MTVDKIRIRSVALVRDKGSAEVELIIHLELVDWHGRNVGCPGTV